MRALVLLIAGAALAGCAHRPEPQALDRSTPAGFAEAPASAPLADAELKAWWTRFGDPVLDDLIERGLSANLDLQQTSARIVQARQAEIVAGARELPQVQADASAARNRISEHAIPLPPGSGQGPPGTPPAAFALPGSEFSTFRVGLDASWELDLFGGARAGVAAAHARTSAAEWSRRDLEVALAAEIASRYVDLRSLQRRQDVADQELARQRELYAIVGARADAGLTSHLDEAQQATQVAAAEARAEPLRAQARAEMHALGVLVGEPPEALIPVLDPAKAAPVAPPAPPPGLPSDLLRRRPDIRRAERDAAAAAAEVGVATADLYPKITLTAQPSLVSTSLSNLVEWGSRNYAFSAGLLWPIFEGGRLKAALASANAGETQSLLAYRKSVLTALKEVEDALARLQADRARGVELQASLQSARAAEALAVDQYRAGVVTYAAALTARQAVTEGEDQAAQADAATVQDVIALYKALGGGWGEDEGTAP